MGEYICMGRGLWEVGEKVFMLRCCLMDLKKRWRVDVFGYKGEMR